MEMRNSDSLAKKLEDLEKRVRKMPEEERKKRERPDTEKKKKLTEEASNDGGWDKPINGSRHSDHAGFRRTKQ